MSQSSEVFISQDQLAQLFSTTVRESTFMNELQQSNQLQTDGSRRDMSFAAPSFGKSNAIEVRDVPQFKMEKNNNLVEQNKQLQESYARILRQNRELLAKRKELELENQELIDENFQLKHSLHETQNLLQLAQTQSLYKRDQEIMNLRAQIRELQRDSLTKNTSITELSTANSNKSYSGIAYKETGSKNPSRFTSPDTRIFQMTK